MFSQLRKSFGPAPGVCFSGHAEANYSNVIPSIIAAPDSHDDVLFPNGASVFKLRCWGQR
jgi:hypothetical protein